MHSTFLLVIITGVALPKTAFGFAFPFENVQLTAADIDDFSAVSFGDVTAAKYQSKGPECRAFPGSADWPSETVWSQFNATLDGALLKPTPVSSVCYTGPNYDAAQCDYLVKVAGTTHYYLDDPLTALTPWPEGGTCMAELKTTGNWHDFGGRSVGAGSLSIWTHHLKDFEFLPNYIIGEYSGMAVRYGSGLEGWELFQYMVLHNISVVAPGGATVGANGGWFGSGGHGILASHYGLGSDQGLSINVVTADGRFVTADPYTNSDLFYALRGGGGGTYGVVTSVVMKAFPSINFTASAFNLTVINGTSALAPGIINTTTTFWEAAKIYYRHGINVVDAGGFGFGYIYPLGNNSFTLTSTYAVPEKTPEEVYALMQPMYDKLRAVGINLTNPGPLQSMPYTSTFRLPPVDNIINTRYYSRLFPRANWEDDQLFNDTMAAIRPGVEAGYNFHNLQYRPDETVAGWPGRFSAVNPAWRKTAMHAALMEVQAVGLTAEQVRENDAKAKKYLDLWRAVTPGSGAYMNEGDPGEPNWQQSFYGDLYGKLLGIKRQRDPWGLFWAPTTVGSEAWEVRTEDDYPGSQNGKLCRVLSAEGDGA
ncbi:hypothetical protein GQ53DRAFT_858410 [Thozetella sp. PMI_491]|nr:hypothetical protein GQ53DRAFT_858410 [Thozetella sp. PMI_491]